MTIPFRAESNGTIDVVVTGLNRKRYESTTVGGTGAYVAINNITIDDDNAGGTSGNGNGHRIRQTVDLGFVLKNNGSATTGTVTTILRASDGGVTVSDSTAGGGTIGAAPAPRPAGVVSSRTRSATSTRFRSP